MNEKKIQKNIDKLKKEIYLHETNLSNPKLNERRRVKIQKQYDEAMEKVTDYEMLLEDPSYADVIHEKMVANSKWTKAANASESIGNKMQSTGRGMVKAGLHTTGAVWTPAIYLGYQAVKQSRKQPKNESVEQDLIELIKEVEQAHKEGKITEKQKREYVINFVDEFYKQ